MFDSNPVSGFITQVRNRINNRDRYSVLIDRENSCLELLSGYSGSVESSKVSSISNMSDSSLSGILDLLKTREQCIEKLNDEGKSVNKVFSNFNELKEYLKENYYCAFPDEFRELNKKISKFGEGNILVHLGDSISEFLDISIDIKEVLLITHGFYMNQNSYKDAKIELLECLNKIQENFEILLAVFEGKLTDIHSFNVVLCDIYCTKAMILFEFGDIECLSYLKKSEEICDTFFNENSEQSIHRDAYRTFAKTKIWLSILSLDPRFVGSNNKIAHDDTIKKSIEKLTSTLKVLEASKKHRTIEELDALEIINPCLLKIDTMLKINDLSSKLGKENPISLQEIKNELSNILDLTTFKEVFQLKGVDLYALTYLLNEIKHLEKEYDTSSRIFEKNADKINAFQKEIIDLYLKTSQQQLKAVFLPQNYHIGRYAQALFESQNIGNRHPLNLIACPHADAHQLDPYPPRQGEVKPPALF